MPNPLSALFFAAVVSLSLNACDRVEYVARSAVADIQKATRLPLNEQIDLCDKRIKAAGRGSVEKCIEQAGYVFISWTYGYAADQKTASAFIYVMWECEKENNSGTRAFDIDGTMACIDRNGWVNSSKVGWTRKQ